MLRRLSTGTFKLEIVENDIQKVTMALDSGGRQDDDGDRGCLARGRIVLGYAGLINLVAGTDHLACDCGIHRGCALRVLCDLSRDLFEVPKGSVNFF
jgi:hypothetical protein